MLIHPFDCTKKKGGEMKTKRNKRILINDIIPSEIR